MQTRTMLGIACACFALATTGRARVAAGADTDVDSAGRAVAQIEAADDIREPTRSVSDGEIGVRAQTALSRELRAPTVKSEVKNGVATLQGTSRTRTIRVAPSER